MNEKQKTVYYCDFCKKHGLSRFAMERHERVCTMNPDRVCRWSIDATEGHADFSLPAVVAQLHARAEAHAVDGYLPSLDTEDIDWLRSVVTTSGEGCPVCMLAALRQSALRHFHWNRRGEIIFNYDKELERFRNAEREYWQQREYRDAMAELY